jgi:hypothetical protein
MDPTTVSIPLVGGPGDGNSVLVVVGPDGRPSLTLCLVGDDGISNAPIYELEVRDDGPSHWRYCFRAMSASGQQP